MKYLAITAILCIILAGASFAGNVTMTEVITGGNLTLTMPSDFSFGSRTLGSTSTSTVGAFKEYVVEDSRGTGAGWNLGFQISQFVTIGTPQRSIQVSKFYTQLNTSIGCVFGQSVDATNGPKSLEIFSTNVQTAEVKFVTAAVNYGMGKYTIEPYHSLGIDADRYAGTYTSTLTATLNNTP